MRKRSRKITYQETPFYPANAEFKQMTKMFPDLRAYTYGDCVVIVGSNQDYGYVMHVKCKDRWPRMDEVIEARKQFVPHNIDMAILVPLTAEKFVLRVHTVTKPKFIPVRDPAGVQLGVERSEAPPD